MVSDVEKQKQLTAMETALLTAPTYPWTNVGTDAG